MTDSSPPNQTTINECSPTSHPPALKALPRPISIRHSQSYEPAPSSLTSQNPANELRGARSSASLNLLANSNSFSQFKTPQDLEQRAQIPPRSSPFSNPFKKLQNTFSSSGKKSLDLGNNNYRNTNKDNNNSSITGVFGSNRSDRIVSSSSSANSLTSWRSKGAEILSKSWGRNRKNSEPLLKNVSGSMSTSPIFGSELEDAIRTSHIPDTPLVPAVLYRCAEFLEVKGVDEVGLYRVPGSHASVQKLKRMFDTGGDYNLLNMDGIDPNDIATLLKLYLRELPSPLMPPALLEQFQSLLSTDRQICHTLRSILIRLPPQNYVVLSFLCHHLSKIASHAEKTKMTVSNLGVVFAPTLAIGSVLFKALLGGFYDGVDTFENREQGLQIVWGVSSQDTRNDIQENYEGENVNIIQERGHNDVDKEYRGSDDDKEEYIDPAVSGLVGDKEEYIDPSVSELVGDKEEYIDSDRNKEDESSYQDQGHNKYQDSNQDPSQQATLIITPFSDNDFGHKGSYFPSPVSHQGSGPVNSDNRTNVESVPEDPLSSTTLSSISLEDITSNDDSILMKAMLEREEVATKAPPPSSPTILGSIQGLSAQAPSATGILDLPSHLTSTATISSELNTTSTASNFSETHKNSGLGLSFPSASIPNLSQNTSALQIAVNTGTEDSTLFSTFAEGIANESLSRKSNENSRIDKLSSLKDASDASRLSLIPLKI